MSVSESIEFLRSQGETLFADSRFAECADNLEAAYSTICRIRKVAGERWDDLEKNYLEKVYSENRNGDVQEAQNALAEICNMTGWATGWNHVEDIKDTK